MPATLHVSYTDSVPFTAHGLSADSRLVEANDSSPDPSITGQRGQRHFEGLVRLFEACAEANEDGDSEPVTEAVYLAAENFARALPTAYPLPDILIHPDGEVAFEWQRDKRRVLTVSVGGPGSVSFAGLCGESSVYGREPFSRVLPGQIAYLLARLFSPSAFETLRRAR